MINANIPLLAGQQQTDLLETAGRGLQLGQGLRQMLALRQAGKMNQIEADNEADTYAQRKAFANNSMFGRELNAALKADQAAKAQALMAQQKHEADTAKTWSDATKNNADAGKIGVEAQGLGLKNSGTLLENANRALTVAAQTGDPMAAKLALNNAYKAGTITPELYEQYTKQVDILGTDPEALKQFAQSITIAGSEKPEQYIQPDANTVANNITSRANNEATVGATLAGQQIQKEIANDKLEFDKSQTSALFTTQQQDIKDGKAKLEVINGVTYLDYGNGRGEIYVDKNGQPMKPVSSTKPESRTETIERKEKAQNFAAASRSAADGATLAASILKRYQALNYNPVQFAAASRIPGSEAYNIVRDTETLKSNIFLARAGDMRGLGALTESEGAKLENSFGSLDPYQGNQFITNLANIAQQFSSIAKNNANKTGLYMGRDGNVVQTTQKPAATAETKPPPPKGLTMSLSEVKQAAQGAGISTEQAVQQLRSQGVIIK